ncbi:MAG: 50S ribosomal protein L30 [Chloroflexi bacterium]|nr:50S ribosomal protein L30 [Chloroflexota bacterium]MYD47455.1 50S ribosomal protein L30 [Chloroflexota bacterium]
MTPATLPHNYHRTAQVRKKMAQIKITWKKSCIGRPSYQRRIVQSLGLKRLNHSVVHEDSPTIMGMVKKVQHLIVVEPAE